jgi:hypothetical protein
MNYLTIPKMPDGECLIYAIRNVVVGEHYIGSTTQPRHRFYHHFRNLRMGKHTSTFLQRAWDKYGEANFIHEPILICDICDRDDWEYSFIRDMGHYNLKKTPDNYSGRVARNASARPDVRCKLSLKAISRHGKKRAEVYDPLCQEAWGLVMAGAYRKDACKAVGIGTSTFWKWIRNNGLKERQF